MKKPNYSDILCVEYKGFLEPILITACNHLGSKIGLTRSKYIRKIIVEAVKKSDFPLDRLSNKFKDMQVGITT
jgi:hypothetical protein